MKIFIALFLIIFVACTTSKKAHSNKDLTGTGSGFDTLNYLREKIVAKKERYIGMPLSRLLSDLKLPVKSYFFGVGRILGIATDITIAFEDSYNIHQRMNNHSIPPLLVIQFDNTLPLDSVVYFRAKGRGQWLQDEERYYGDKIIADFTYVK